jgi:small basic protein
MTSTLFHSTYQIGDSAPFSIFSTYNLIGIVGCVFWFLAYGFVIHKSYKDKAYGIPMLAICLNFAWELLASFVWENPIPLWRLFYRIWFVLDLVIVAQLFLYGRRHQRVPAIARHFNLVTIVTFLGAVLGQWAFTQTFYDPLGFITAFMINLVMSVLFIFMFFERPGLEGLSYPAAWCKMFGTLCTSIECYVFLPIIHPHKTSFAFTHFLFGGIWVLDCVFIGLLTRALWLRRVQTNAQPSAQLVGGTRHAVAYGSE